MRLSKLEKFFEGKLTKYDDLRFRTFIANNFGLLKRYEVKPCGYGYYLVQCGENKIYLKLKEGD